MKVQLIRTVCDICYGRGEETLAMSNVSTTVMLGNRVVEIDLCEDDSKKLADQLADVFAQGRRPDSNSVVQPPRRRRTRAQVTEDDARRLLNGDTPIGRAVNGGRATRRPGKWDRCAIGDGTYRCPDPDCTHAPFTGPTGIGRHVQTQHPALVLAA